MKVGAIFTLKTINGMVSKIAIKAAEKDVNSDETILGGTKLSISFYDSNYSGFLGIIGGTILFSCALLSCFIVHFFNKNRKLIFSCMVTLISNNSFIFYDKIIVEEIFVENYACE